MEVSNACSQINIATKGLLNFRIVQQNMAESSATRSCDGRCMLGDMDRNGINASISLKDAADDFTLKDDWQVVSNSFLALSIKRTKRLSVRERTQTFNQVLQGFGQKVQQHHGHTMRRYPLRTCYRDWVEASVTLQHQAKLWTGIIIQTRTVFS